MNVNEMSLWMQMAQMAAQFSQGSLPQVGSSSGAGEKSQFQTMLEDKKAQTAPERPAKEPQEPAQTEKEPVQEAPGGQAPETPPKAGEDRLTAELAAALLAAGLTVETPAVVQAPQEAAPPAEAPVLADPALAVEAQAPAVQAQVQADPVQAPVAKEEPAPAQTQLQEAPRQQPEAQQAVQPVAREGTQARPEAPEVPVDGKRAQEAPDAAAAQESAAGTPLFQEVEAMPVKVGDAPALDTTAETFDAGLSRAVLKALEQGEQKLELRLSPEHLGSLTVELSRSETGILHVVLRTESEQAAHLLREHASVLSGMLQGSGQGEVRVEVPQAQETERPWQQPDPNGGRQEQGQSRQQEQQPRREEGEDFLHQLRLGLFQTETA